MTRGQHLHRLVREAIAREADALARDEHRRATLGDTDGYAAAAAALAVAARTRGAPIPTTLPMPDGFPALARWRDEVIRHRRHRAPLEVAAAYELVALDCQRTGDEAGERVARAAAATALRQARSEVAA